VAMNCGDELLHKASLLHDDLIDRDKFRRGKQAFWIEHSENEAISVGDFLVAMAFSTIDVWINTSAHKRNDEIRSSFHETFLDMAAGEVLDISYEGDQSINADHIDKMIYLKSGSLIAASLRLGALAANAPHEICTALTEYGKALGTAFQMVNDVNNLSGLDEATKGLFGQDLEKGKQTLATRLALSSNITAKDLRSMTIQERQELLLPAQIQIRDKLQQASKHLISIPDGKMKIILKLLIEQIQDDWFWVDNNE